MLSLLNFVFTLRANNASLLYTMTLPSPQDEWISYNRKTIMFRQRIKVGGAFVLTTLGTIRRILFHFLQSCCGFAQCWKFSIFFDTAKRSYKKILSWIDYSSLLETVFSRSREIIHVVIECTFQCVYWSVVTSHWFSVVCWNETKRLACTIWFGLTSLLDPFSMEVISVMTALLVWWLPQCSKCYKK